MSIQPEIHTDLKPVLAQLHNNTLTGPAQQMFLTKYTITIKHTNVYEFAFILSKGAF